MLGPEKYSNLGFFAHPLKKVQSRMELPSGSQGRIMLHEISTGIVGDRPFQAGVYCFAYVGQIHPKFSDTELLFTGVLEQ